MWYQREPKGIHKTNKSAAIREVFMEFCSNSTIHAVKYFTEPNRHLSERLWWMGAFGLSVLLCGLSIQNILINWNENPVSMSFTEKPVPISTIPFPTVILCSETKTNSSKLNVTSAYDLLRGSWAYLQEIEIARIEALIHLCQFYIPEIRFSNWFTNESIYDLIKDMAPNFQKTVFYCMWQHTVKPCTEYLTPVLTDEGLCYTFNALNSRDIYTDEMAPEMMTVDQNPNVSHWKLESGYDDDVNATNAYPIRVFTGRQSASLVLFLGLFEKDLDYVCRSLVPGFKIFLETPGEMAGISRQSLRLPLSEEAELSIKPTLVHTSNGLRTYKPSERQCFFNSERQLRYYKIYSQNNCESECLSNFTAAQCKCVKFSMPRNSTTKICGAASFDCYQTSERKLFGEDVIDGIKDNVAKTFRENCNCLPACTTIKYDATIDRAKLDWIPTLSTYKNVFKADDKNKMRPSVVTIFFSSHHVETYKRVEVYTYSNLLAICGGLLGLFLGVSLLSIIEFIYYSTLRLYWTLRQWKSQNAVEPFKRQRLNTIFIDIPN